MTRTIPTSRHDYTQRLRTLAHDLRDPRSAEFYHDLADALSGAARFRDDPEPTTNITNIVTAPARNTDPTTSRLAAIRDFSTGRGKLLKAFGDSQFPMTSERACRLAGINGTASPWKRVSELKKAGIIEPTGIEQVSSRGAKVTEYRLTDFGRAEYGRIVESTDG
jgi:hypothetical protein